MSRMIFLADGKHGNAAEGLCAMEWCAWAAGEPHTDHPRCVSGLIGEFVRPLNDVLGDEERQRLIPVLLDCIGTNVGLEADHRRLLLVLQWVVAPYPIARVQDAVSFWRALLTRGLCDQFMDLMHPHRRQEREWVVETLAHVARIERSGWTLAAAGVAAYGVGRGFRSLDSALELIRALCAVGRNPIQLDEARVNTIREAAVGV